jgi:hypothetical protein
MIGGIIVLSLFLTALTAMMFVSQQYDSYQNIVNRMSQYDIDRFSENLVADFPGLSPPSSGSCSGSPSGNCNQYTMTLSNVGGLTNSGSSNGISGGSGGGVDISIVRIYITSVVSGCTSAPCILGAANSATAYSFLSSDSHLNSGEFNHAVLLWLPDTITLYNPSPPSPSNTISIITNRGRVFTFQWPFPPVGTALGGQSGAAVSTGVMKIAYQGQYDSSKEGIGQPSPPATCHNEAAQPYPAGTGYKEVLNPISGVTGNSLTFVNPWFTDAALSSAYSGQTTLYVLAKVINTAGENIQVKGGGLVISAASSGANSKQYFIGGTLFGIYYGGVFYTPSSAPPINDKSLFYAIFKINSFTQNISAPGLLFTGTASLSNEAQDQSYFSGEIVLDGIYDRASC